MAETQSLEEAWEELFATAARIPLASPAEFQSAVRALALAPLEELDLPCCGATGEDDDPAWCGNPVCLQAGDMRRQIKELGT